MGEDSRVPPLSRRVPGATAHFRPAGPVEPPKLPESLLRSVRAALEAEPEAETDQETAAPERTSPKADDPSPAGSASLPQRMPGTTSGPKPPTRAVRPTPPTSLRGHPSEPESVTTIEDATQPIPAISHEVISYLASPVADEITDAGDETAPQEETSSSQEETSSREKSSGDQPSSRDEAVPPDVASEAPTGGGKTANPEANERSHPAAARNSIRKANGRPAAINGHAAAGGHPPPPQAATVASPAAAEWWVQDQPRGGEPLTGRRYRLIGLVASIAVLVTAGSIVFSLLSGAGGHDGTALSAAELRAEEAARGQAATWVAAQVSRASVVACDPAMCQALQAHGFPGAQLLPLGPAAPYPVNAAVVVATPAVRNQFGSSLAAAYAPVVLASFGTGIARIDIRVIAPHGAAAYVAALKADVTARKQYAVPLLQSGRFDVLPLAARQLKAGQVDTRLLIATAGIAPSGPMIIQDFGTSAPGASPGVPLRYVDLTMTDRAPLTRSSPFVQSVLKQLSRQSGQQFRPAHVQLVRSGGQLNVLRIEFPAPSPLGLFGPG